jgi:hypothetical protein
VTVVDGGEVYSPRTAVQFEHFYAWMKHGLADSGAVVPHELRGSYATAVSVGFMVYDDSSAGVPMDVSAWGPMLGHALARTDRYVFAYTELYDWWGTGWPTSGAPPQAWLDATDAARLGLA